MRLDQILDETLELLIANYEDPRFKSFGALKKSEYQNSKSQEELENRSLMYKGQVVDKSKVRRGHKLSQETIEKGRATRKAWYKNPENYKKFRAKLDARKKVKNKTKDEEPKPDL